MKPRHLAFLAIWLALLACWLPRFGLAAPNKEILRIESKMVAAIDAGDLREAERIVRTMIEYVDNELKDDHENRSYVYADASNIYRLLQQYERAVEFGRKALEESRRAFAPDSPRVASVMMTLANAEEEVGHVRESEAMLRNALAIWRNRYGAESEDYAKALHNLAITVKSAGRYAEAQTLYRQALKLQIKLHGPDHHSVGRIYYNLARLCDDQGRETEAEDWVRLALANFKKSRQPNDPAFIETYRYLGHLCVNSSRFDDAEKYFRRAIEINKFCRGTEDVYAVGTELANLYSAQGRYADEDRICRENLAVLQRDKANQLTIAIYLGRLAVALGNTNKDVESEQKYTEQLQILERYEGELGRRGSSHFFRGMARWRLEKREQAAADFHEAIKFFERDRSQRSGSTADQAYTFAGLRAVYDMAGIYALANSNSAQAFDYFERGRSRGLLDQMNAAHFDPLQGLSADQAAALQGAVIAAQQKVKRAEQELDEARQRVDAGSAQGKQELAQLLQQLATARFVLVDAEANLTNASPVYRKAMSREMNPPSLKQMTAWSQEQSTAMLYYAIPNDMASLLYVDPFSGQTTVLPLELTPAQAESLGVEQGDLTNEKITAILAGKNRDGVIDMLRNPHRTAEQHQKMIGQLAALWNVLVPQKVQEKITDGKIKRLVILPSGGLAYLPFEALVVKRDGANDITYMLDVCPPTIYAPSATVLMNLMSRLAPREPADRLPVLTVGDPKYDAPGDSASVAQGRKLPDSSQEFARAGGSLKSLPFSGDESKAVAKSFQLHKIGVGQLLQGLATEASIRLNAPRRTVLHLACHGFATSEYGNFFGGLAVAKGPRAAVDPADDGVLTVAEIYALDLRHCELAILSACQTNIGPSDAGEGVWAISRAFLVAGARRVVASCWEVDDAATSTLMAKYCESVAAGMERKQTDYAEGLHVAKRALRKSKQAGDPAFWAPFVLVGPQ
jgi:CHAT domain-containing protein/tetratricopeptide (TPR) repeat protein